jgi:hypothetical protein
MDIPRYLLNKIRKFKRYIFSSNVYDVISIKHSHDLEKIDIYSISPLIVNLCFKSLMMLLGLGRHVGDYVDISTHRITITNTWCSRTPVLSSILYSIRIELSIKPIHTNLKLISCKRLSEINYNPDLLPLDLIDTLSDIDPIITLRYIYDDHGIL